jgi:hypothetical protein
MGVIKCFKCQERMHCMLWRGHADCNITTPFRRPASSVAMLSYYAMHSNFMLLVGLAGCCTLADIVEEMHRLRSLQQQHAARQRSKFSAAFAAGLLHHPADDAPPAPAAPPADPNDPAGAAAAAGLRHVVVPQGQRVAGPVPAERVLDGGQPVLVDDAWGRHLMVADSSDEEGQGSKQEEAGAGSSSYSRGLMARLARMGLVDSSSAGGWGAVGRTSEHDDWGEVEHSDNDSSDEQNGWAERYNADSVEQQQGNGHHAAVLPAQAPLGAEGEGSASRDLRPAAEANGSSLPAAATGSSSGLLAGAVDADELGLPEAAEAAQAAAAGVAVATQDDAEQRSYGDGALGAIMRKVPL